MGSVRLLRRGADRRNDIGVSAAAAEIAAHAFCVCQSRRSAPAVEPRRGVVHPHHAFPCSFLRFEYDSATAMPSKNVVWSAISPAFHCISPSEALMVRARCNASACAAASG
jgi:hypothetical protein